MLLSLLSMKTAFLVAITSGRRVLKLQALLDDMPYAVFYKDKVSVRPHLKFMSKVVSAFHLNQSIQLLVFFPKPHSPKGEESLFILDVCRTLACYLDHLKSFRASSRLFVAMLRDSKATQWQFNISHTGSLIVSNFVTILQKSLLHWK